MASPLRVSTGPPASIVGAIADRPEAHGVPPGSLYFSTDTDEVYMALAESQGPNPRRERLADALATVTCVDAPTWRYLLDGPSGLWLQWRAGWVTHREGNADLTITNPREAWEALATAGLIGLGDVDVPTRRFWYFDDVAACDSCGGFGTGGVNGFHGEPEDCRACGGSGRGSAGNVDRRPVFRPNPRSVSDAVALASDWANVLAVEAIARQGAGAPATAVVEYVSYSTESTSRWVLTGVRREDPLSAAKLEAARLGYAFLDAVGSVLTIAYPTLDGFLGRRPR